MKQMIRAMLAVPVFLCVSFSALYCPGIIERTNDLTFSGITSVKTKRKVNNGAISRLVDAPENKSETVRSETNDLLTNDTPVFLFK